MSENTIKPSEVSDVLLQQLKGIDTSLQFDEVAIAPPGAVAIAQIVSCTFKRFIWIQLIFGGKDNKNPRHNVRFA